MKYMDMILFTQPRIDQTRRHIAMGTQQERSICIHFYLYRGETHLGGPLS